MNAVKPLTIGYVLDDTLDRPDGVQQAVLNIGEHMRSLGHDVHYIVATTDRSDIQNVHVVGRFWSLRFNGNSVRTPRPVSRAALKQLFADVDFDVLHVQMPYSPLLAARVIRSAPAKTRLVGTFHILPYSRLAATGTWALGKLLRSTTRRFNRAYAVSEPARAFMQRTFGLKGSVLPNPVDYHFFQSARPALSSKKGVKRIVYVGRFEDRKGVLRLLAAYSLISPDLRSSTELVMVGKGPLLDQVRERSQAGGLDVQTPGFVSELEKAQYLSGADVAVFPSTSGESFGIVLAEAMAAGATITIGGNNPGYASVLHDWPQTLFDPTDAAAFAAKLTQMLSDSQSTRMIGHEQHQAAQNYDIACVADTLIAEAYYP